MYRQQIKENIEKFLNNAGELESEVIFIGLTGSNVFFSREERNTDIDYLIVCKNLTAYMLKTTIEIDNVVFDCFIYNENFLNELLSYTIEVPHLQYWNLFYYFMPVLFKKNEETSFVFDLSQHKDEYIKTIIHKLKTIGFSETSKVKLMPQYKTIVMAYIAMEFIKSGNSVLTKEIKKNVCKLYQDGDFELYTKIGDFFNLELNYQNIVW
jgi:hypothetical protein